MANPLILRGGGPSRLVELRRPVADALAAAGVVQVALTDRPGWWEVTPGTQIGVVSVAGLQVVIEPKIDINRLVFLMGYARRPDFWRDDRVLLDADADLPEALADAFVRLARRALEQGLLKGYMTVDETLAVLRGRVREADQLRRRWGRSIPLEVCGTTSSPSTSPRTRCCWRRSSGCCGCRGSASGIGRGYSGCGCSWRT